MTEPKIPEGVAKHVEEAMARLWKKWQLRELPYKPGDLIGQEYEVYGFLGAGGFGVVYLVYDHETKNVYALKTFRDKYLRDDRIRELFRKEAQTWVNLERYPYLVRAYWVDEIAGRLYIAMEYIAPDEQGLNSLHGYLELQPPDLAQSLRWAIQFCHGMEYACSKGIKCHRDIKPDNIMISDNTVKISDFGLAAAAPQEVAGALGYIAPEILEGRGADERSDIYSFGIVLYQMATGSPHPPQRGWFGGIPSINGPMQSIVQRCLNNNPDERYPTFEALRNDLASLLKEKTGEVIKPPDVPELKAWELSNKGLSLSHLGHFDEAIFCLNEAIRINPRFAGAYTNRGLAYAKKGSYDLAIADYNKALEINLRDAEAYYNRGLAYDNKGDYDLAIADYNKALEINPSDAEAYNNRGVAYYGKGEYERAMADYNKALGINPRFAEAQNNRGSAYNKKGEYDLAIADYNKAVDINPRYAEAYSNRGRAYHNKGEYDRVIADYTEAIKINPRYAEAYNNRGVAYYRKRLYDLAIEDHSRAIKINPSYAEAYYNRGLAYYDKGEYDRAIADYNKAVEINPSDAEAYNNRGLAYYDKGEYDLAIADYNKALEINPRYALAYNNRAVAYYAKGEYDKAWGGCA